MQPEFPTPWSTGSQPYRGRIPVVRLGGHREEHETGWQCAVREVYEEARLCISPLTARTTYVADGDHLEAELEEIRWDDRADQEPAPLLAVRYCRDGKTLLSLMYLARAEGLPAPSSEVKGLLLLEEKDVHWLCQEPLTLEQYPGVGGKAILNGAFDSGMILEPFAQLRLLSRILTAEAQGATATEPQA